MSSRKANEVIAKLTSRTKPSVKMFCECGSFVKAPNMKRGLEMIDLHMQMFPKRKAHNSPF